MTQHRSNYGCVGGAETQTTSCMSVHCGEERDTNYCEKILLLWEGHGPKLPGGGEYHHSGRREKKCGEIGNANYCWKISALGVREEMQTPSVNITIVGKGRDTNYGGEISQLGGR